MSKTNKQFRSLDEKQHHVAKAIKKEVNDRSVKSIDRALKNKRYDQFFDEQRDEEEYWDEQR